MVKRIILASFSALAGLAFSASPGLANAVSENDLRQHIEILASDAFEGREPGTEGERKTTDYIVRQWEKAGLKPAATNGGWLDPVALVRRGPESSEARFYAKGEKLRFADQEIVLVGTEASYVREKQPLWFAGYGITADGKVPGDVAGKAVLMLADQPSFAAEEMKSVRARREALIAAGAETILAIGGEQASFPVIRRQLMSRPIILQSREKRAALEGVVGAQFAVAMVTAAGGDWDNLRKSANMGDFAGAPLGITADFRVTTSVRAFDSHNVIGKLKGKKPESGAVLYMAHWDHLGLCRPEGDEDRICNGAVDNASGIAVLTEVAERLAKKRHDRDIYFLATTAEESGLLGAYAFAEKPPLALDKIIIALNIDTIALAPRGSQLAVVGRGLTSLDRDIEAIAKKAGRKIDTSPYANEFLRRQDGWVLTQKGVPAFMIGSAFGDMALAERFLSSDYHGPDDELSATTELGGAADDAMLHIDLGRYFASRRFKAADKLPNNNGGPNKTGG